MLSQVDFREATGADVAAMGQCRKDSEGDPGDPRIGAYFDGKHHPQQALPPRVGYAALVDGKLVGYIAGHLTTRHGCEGEVQYLFVAKKYRRQAIATELLRLLSQWFGQHDAKKICIAIANDSPPEAKPFYEAAGATPLRKFFYGFEDIASQLRL